MSEQPSYPGRCFCGTVQLQVTGRPAAMGYCHCASCREWSAGPINAFSLWDPNAVRITQGAERLGSFALTPQSIRRWCRDCGGHVLTEHPHWNLTDVYAAVIPGFPFQPGVHVHYQEGVLHISDGLPKLKDLPAEMGGSGETIAE